jgi:hypothetical protein
MTWIVSCPHNTGRQGDPCWLFAHPYTQAVAMKCRTTGDWWVLQLCGDGLLRPYRSIDRHARLQVDGDGKIIVHGIDWYGVSEPFSWPERLPFALIGDTTERPGAMWLREYNGAIEWWASMGPLQSRLLSLRPEGHIELDENIHPGLGLPLDAQGRLKKGGC